MNDLCQQALETQAILATTFWESLKEDMRKGRKGRKLAAITRDALDACMTRISEILDGDPTSAYPPGFVALVEERYPERNARLVGGAEK